MTEKFSQNVAAIGLTIVTIICVIGAIVLAWDDASVPDMLQVIGGASAGALGAQLARDGGGA